MALSLYPQPVPPGETIYGNFEAVSWVEMSSGTVELRVFALGIEIPDTRSQFKLCEIGVECPTPFGALISGIVSKYVPPAARFVSSVEIRILIIADNGEEVTLFAAPTPLTHLLRIHQCEACSSLPQSDGLRPYSPPRSPP